MSEDYKDKVAVVTGGASGIGFAPMAYQSLYSATKSALIGLTGSLRYELWDESIRLSTVIPGTVAPPIWNKAGGAPESAKTPDESARAILKGLAANERIVIVTDADRDGSVNAFRPDAAKGVDDYLLSVARQRKSGKMVV